MNAPLNLPEKNALFTQCLADAMSGNSSFVFMDAVPDVGTPMPSTKVVRSSPKNAKPMIGKDTANGILAVLEAVDYFAIQDDPVAMKGVEYMRNFAAYLKSDAYRSKSEKQARIAKEWRAVNGQSRNRNKTKAS